MSNQISVIVCEHGINLTQAHCLICQSPQIAAITAERDALAKELGLIALDLASAAAVLAHTKEDLAYQYECVSAAVRERTDANGRVAEHYVRAEKAEAEVARLRGLVEAAYREGFNAGECIQEDQGRVWSSDREECWTNSDAKRSLDGGGT